MTRWLNFYEVVIIQYVIVGLLFVAETIGTGSLLNLGMATISFLAGTGVLVIYIRKRSKYHPESDG